MTDDSGDIVTSGAPRRPRRPRPRGRGHPAAAGGRPDGHPGLHPRPGRAVRRADPRPDARRGRRRHGGPRRGPDRRGAVQPAGGRATGPGRNRHRRDREHHRRLGHAGRPRRPRPPHDGGGRQVLRAQRLAAHPDHANRRAGAGAAAPVRGGAPRRGLRVGLAGAAVQPQEPLQVHPRPRPEPDVRRGRAAGLVPALTGGPARQLDRPGRRCSSSSRCSSRSASARCSSA